MEMAAKEKEPNYALQISKVLLEARAARIREARARVPPPTYQQIAMEVGCSEKTVHNILTGKTRAQ